MSIYDEIQAESERALAKFPTDVYAVSSEVIKLSVLMEEVGEVAREFCDRRINPDGFEARLREELIQVASVAARWAASL